MKLYTNCKSCQKSFKIQSSASNRPDLEDEKGERFKVTCEHCGTAQEKHVNDIRAKQNVIINVIGVLLGVIVTVGLWNTFGAISTVSGLIPVLIYKMQDNAINQFNKYRVRRS